MTDTICALASGAPPAAIGVLRVSGPDAGAVTRTRLVPGELPPRHMTRVNCVNARGEIIDTGLAAWFPAPASYTGEDTLELYLHGGRAVIDDALDAVLSVPGVRLAAPGEFTRRAFEAGKLDLTEAEGVADLIDAETRAQREQAIRQVGGHLSITYDGWRKTLVEALALVEVAIDFPDEEDAPDFTHDEACERIDALVAEIDAALDDEGLGERVRDGFRIALIGPPNAGKSSLLNRLAGREAAIVTERAGTTRDRIEVRLSIAGHLVWLIDTAGLRSTDDDIEAEGVRRALDAAQESDMRLLVLSPPRGAEDDHVDCLQPGDLVLENKCDLDADRPRAVSRETLHISALTGEGVEALVSRIGDRIKAQVARQAPPLITRRRHRDSLHLARAHLDEAARGLRQGIGAELAAEDLRCAAAALAALTGAIGVEDVLGEVFAGFCIGK